MQTRCLPAWVIGYQAWRACVVLPARWPAVGSCLWESTHGASRHSTATRWGTQALRSSVRYSFTSARRVGDCIFVPIYQRVHPIFSYPALGVKGWERYLVKVLPVDAMAVWPQDIHAIAEGLLYQDSLFVLLMPNVIFHSGLFLCLSPFWRWCRMPLGLNTSSGASQCIQLLGVWNTHPSSLPTPSCWSCCADDGPVDSPMYHNYRFACLAISL